MYRTREGSIRVSGSNCRYELKYKVRLRPIPQGQATSVAIRGTDPSARKPSETLCPWSGSVDSPLPGSTCGGSPGQGRHNPREKEPGSELGDLILSASAPPLLG